MSVWIRCGNMWIYTRSECVSASLWIRQFRFGLAFRLNLPGARAELCICLHWNGAIARNQINHFLVYTMQTLKLEMKRWQLDFAIHTIRMGKIAIEPHLLSLKRHFTQHYIMSNWFRPRSGHFVTVKRRRRSWLCKCFSSDICNRRSV